MDDDYEHHAGNHPNYSAVATSPRLKGPIIRLTDREMKKQRRELGEMNKKTPAGYSVVREDSNGRPLGTGYLDDEKHGPKGIRFADVHLRARIEVEKSRERARREGNTRHEARLDEERVVAKKLQEKRQAQATCYDPTTLLPIKGTKTREPMTANSSAFAAVDRSNHTSAGDTYLPLSQAKKKELRLMGEDHPTNMRHEGVEREYSLIGNR